MTTWITKGDRIVARWYAAHPASLAGAQTKTAATERVVEGVVRHVRGDHPTDPTSVRLFIETADGERCERCGVNETIVDPEHVVSVNGRMRRK